MAGLSDRVYGLLSGLGVPRRRRRAATGGIIFAFHDVIANPGHRTGSAWRLHIDAVDFARYVDFIAAEFTVVPLGEMAQRARDGRSLRGLAALTFDDAYRGVFDHALPLLRQRRLPSTVFVVSGASEAPAAFWWDTIAERQPALSDAQRDALLGELQGDRERIYRHFGLAPWTEAPAAMLAADWSRLQRESHELVTWGAHTVTHRHLPSLPDDELRSELVQSRAAIAGRLGVTPDQFSYPYGTVDRRVVEAARAAGYRSAVTLEYGWASPGDDVHALRRVNVPAQIALPTLDCWAASMRWFWSR